MSAKTRKPNELDKLVTKRDLVRLIAAFNEATRNLESRIEDLEKARELDAEDVGAGVPFVSTLESESVPSPLIQVVR